MSKLTRKKKIEIYQKRKLGIPYTVLSKKYGVSVMLIRYFVALIDKHGEKVLKENSNRHYSVQMKEEMVKQVLIDGETQYSVALKYALSGPGVLSLWVKSYKEKADIIVDKEIDRRSTMKYKFSDRKLEDISKDEKDEYLEYLEAENAVLKKLRAVVQARKNRQQKKK